MKVLVVNAGSSSLKFMVFDQQGETYTLTLRAENNKLVATIQGGGQSQTIEWTDENQPYVNGQIGLSTWHGSHTRYESVAVSG